MRRNASKSSLKIIMAFCMMSLLATNNLYAAEKKDKSAKKAAMMMQKMKQDFEAEKAGLQLQFDEQKKSLEAEKAKQSVLASEHERKYRTSSAEARRLSSEKSGLEQTLAKTKEDLATAQAELADLKAQQQKSLADLQENDGQRKVLVSNIASTTKTLNECQEKNEKLYIYGKELVQIYDQPSTYESIMRKESFFQLKRVELENILQGKMDQIEEQKLRTSTR